MTDMLDQAVIDAESLKVASFELAKKMINENYQIKIKEAVNKILEAGDDALDLGDLGGNPDLSSLPPTPDDSPVNGSSDGEASLSAPVSQDQPSLESPLAGVPQSHEGDSDDVISLDLKMLEEMIMKEMSDMSSGSVEGSVERDELCEEISEELSTPETIDEETKNLFESNDEEDPEKKELEENLEKLGEENEELKESLSNKEKEINKLKENLTKHKEAVEKLKKLAESRAVKIGQLFYSNKVLMDESLSEKQKRSLVESISKAESIDKAKTICELGITSTGTTKVAPKSLQENLNVRSTTVFPSSKKETEIDPAFERVRFLAGIKAN